MGDEVARQGGLVPAGERGLATRSADLAKRGLELLAARQARAVRFPDDRSLGSLYVRDTLAEDELTPRFLAGGFLAGAPREQNYYWYFFNGYLDDGWEQLGEDGEARGVVTVPPGKILKLHVRPDQLPALSKLSADDVQALEIRGERITESHLAPLQNLRGLKELQVYSSTMVAWAGSADAGLAYVGKLQQLERLRLFGSAFTDFGLMHLRSLTCLRTLVPQLPQMTGVGLAHLQRLPKLEHLALRGMGNTHTALTGAALAHVSNLASIRVLSLAGMPVRDIDLIHLQKLANLEVLDLSMPEQYVPGSAG